MNSKLLMINVPEQVYRILPVPFQSLLITGKGAFLSMQRYGRDYRTRKSWLDTVYAMTREQLLQHQLIELRSLLEFAGNRSNYYRGILSDVSPRDIRCVDDLKQLPILEKEMLRVNAEEIYTVRPRTAVVAHTGGTTGKPLVVRFTRRDMQRRIAELDVFKARHGASNGMRRASFSGKHIVFPKDEAKGVFWRTNWTLNQRFYSTYHLSEANMAGYVENLNQFKPEIIDGFTSCIYDICRYVAGGGRSFEFRPAAVFPTSEPLYPHQRELIRSVLGTEPRDQYASSEGAPFITECPEGSLHYHVHTGVIENDDNGDALITSFTSYGTPLIRYRIGDRITFRQGQCECGWPTPLVERIEGRVIDFLSSPERGRIYSPNLANVVKNLPNSVIQTQFVQHAPDGIEVRVVVDESAFHRDELPQIIIKEVRRTMGSSMSVRVEIVSEIPRSASGKVRFVVNTLQT
jgi:phenylacetate-CoA ligase